MEDLQTGSARFDFSIITALYNSENYLEKAVESVLGQSIGFEKHVQLILVDDGSTDSSGELCDRYMEQYPQNIFVIHKEHSGISMSRNEGLQHAAGKYVNFLDSDDVLSSDALAKAKEFFECCANDVNIVSIPMYFFGSQRGPHPLNQKFRKGSRVIDLEREPDCFQLSCASAFIRADAMRRVRFEAGLSYAEDAKACVSLLLGSRKLGVVAGAKYHYRRGISRAFSDEAEWYLPVVEGFALDTIRKAKDTLGEVPRFVQYSVMYVMLRRYRVPLDRLRQAIGEDEARRYIRLCYDLLEHVDDAVLLSAAPLSLNVEEKCFLLSKKHRAQPQLQKLCDMRLYAGGTGLGLLSQFATRLESMQLEENRLRLDGYTTFLGVPASASVRVYLVVNGTDFIACSLDKRYSASKEYLGETVLPSCMFRGEIQDLGRYREFECKICTEVNSIPIDRTRITAGKFFPIAPNFRQSYAVAGNWMVTFRGNALRFETVSPGAVERQETALLKEFSNLKTPAANEAIRLRKQYRMLKPLCQREIWLVSDRIEKADDNGEAIFQYMAEANAPVDRYFILHQDSPDRERVAKYGVVVDYRSEQHKLLHLLADKLVSSQTSEYVRNPFLKEWIYYRDILWGKRQIFLQHGTIYTDHSSWLNQYKTRFSLFVTSAIPEYKALSGDSYCYDAGVVQLTGLPRHDYLEDRNANKIFVMPTWRKSLSSMADFAGTGQRTVTASFRKSRFFLFYDALLNDPRLLQAARLHGYTVCFMPHPNLMPSIHQFRQAEGVVFCSIATRYRDVYAEGSLVVTDYSSAQFDFAYLRKPLVYCHFENEEEFFSTQVYGKGYFEYETDGFGEVERDLDGTVARIVEYMENGCRLKDKYRERIDRFFAFHDKDNCKRVYEAILRIGRDTP